MTATHEIVPTSFHCITSVSVLRARVSSSLLYWAYASPWCDTVHSQLAWRVNTKLPIDSLLLY